jgi:hypothetical protein
MKSPRVSVYAPAMNMLHSWFGWHAPLLSSQASRTCDSPLSWGVNRSLTPATFPYKECSVFKDYLFVKNPHRPTSPFLYPSCYENSSNGFSCFPSLSLATLLNLPLPCQYPAPQYLHQVCITLALSDSNNPFLPCRKCASFPGYLPIFPTALSGSLLQFAPFPSC